MIQFIDKALLKRYRILEVVNNSPNYSVSQKKLLEVLDISVGTLTRLTKAIKDDFEAFDCGENIQLSYNETTKTYHLDIAEDFSLQFIRLFYLENSVRFKLLEGMFADELGDMAEVAEQFFITYSSLRRELHFLKKELMKYGLNISTKKKIGIRGDELHIRFFFTILFLDSYGGQAWPFKYIHQHDIQQLCTLFPSEIFNPLVAEKRILLSIFTANSIVRAKNGHVVTIDALHVPLFSSPHESYHQSVNALNSSLKKMLPLLNRQQCLIETTTLLSCVLAFGSYHGIQRATSFFYLNKELQQQDFLSPIFHLMNQLEKFAISPITNDEYNTIFNKLCLTHYRVLLINNTAFVNLPVWQNPNDDLLTFNRKRIALFTQAFEKELAHPLMSKFIDYKSYLLFEYHNILLHSLDWEKHRPNIRVLFLSKYSSHKLQSMITNAFQAFYKFDCTFELTSEVDLIVSDIILSEQTLSAIGTNKSVVYVQPTVSVRDYQKVGRQLATLTWRKLKQSLHREEGTASEYMYYT